MKKLFLAIMLLSGTCMADDQNYWSTKLSTASVGIISVSASTFTATSMDSTAIRIPSRYILTNLDTSTDAICGYDINVSTITGNAKRGFRLPKVAAGVEFPVEKNVGGNIKIWCKAEDSVSAISILREIQSNRP